MAKRLYIEHEHFNISYDQVGQNWFTLDVTPALIKNALCRRSAFSNQKLDKTLEVASEFTHLTNIEILFQLYSTFPKEERDQKKVRKMTCVDTFIYPSIGNEKEVQIPHMDKVIENINEKKFAYQKDTIALPLFIIHTHPSINVFPSENDLKNPLEAHTKTLKVNGKSYDIQNPQIYITSGRGYDTFSETVSTDNHLIYQYLNSETDHAKLMKIRNELIRLKPEEFVKELNNSKAFQAMYFGPGELFGKETYYQKDRPELIVNEIKKNHLNKIAQKFQYKIHLKRRV